MSIYNHVANKDALLDAVVERVNVRHRARPGSRIPWRTNPWRRGRFRDVALAHPQVAVLMLTRGCYPRSAPSMREAVAPVLSLGIPVNEAVDDVRPSTAFLTGSILRELGSGLSLAGWGGPRRQTRP